MPASESGVDPRMVLSRTSICAWMRTWSVTFSVGSRRKRRFAPPMFLVPQFCPGLPAIAGRAIVDASAVGRRRAVEGHRKGRQPVVRDAGDDRPARHVRVAEAEEEVVHVVVAQTQIAVELEDLHLLLVLIGVAAERLEVGGAILLGRLFGGPLFLLRVRRRRLHATAAGRAESAGLICAAAGRASSKRAALASASRRRPFESLTRPTPRRARTARRPSSRGARRRRRGRARPGAASRR